MKDEQARKSFGWVVGEDKVLSIDEVRRLRRYCCNLRIIGLKKNKFYCVRNWFVIELGLLAGLRVSEMVQLKDEDLLVEGEKSSIIVKRGKGGKRRAVWINTQLKKSCRQFLDIRRKFFVSAEEGSYILTSGNGKQATKRALQKQFKICLKKAGISEKYSIHCLRHTYATFLLKSGRDLKLVKEQLGHSSIKITEVYISLIRDDVMKALEGIYNV